MLFCRQQGGKDCKYEVGYQPVTIAVLINHQSSKGDTIARQHLEVAKTLFLSALV